MNYFQRNLSSLDALVFFEAAARLQNFTHAAQELNVTQVAVSKRIRSLEVDLGVVLFLRQGRKLRLTAEGQWFAERMQVGLSFLGESIAKVRETRANQPKVIKVAANENINFFWLAPLIRSYQLAGNDAVVSVLTANNVTDVVQADTDLAIFHGKSAPEGWTEHVLFEEVVAPVAAPSYQSTLAASSGRPLTLLDYYIEAPDWVNWGSLSAQAADWFPATRIRRCSSYIQSVSLAMAGEGLALGVLPMLQRELSEGTLELAVPSPIQTGRKYYLSTPMARPVSNATQTLLTFLRGYCA